MVSGPICAHEWTRDTKGGSATTVILACQSCGAASVSNQTLRGQVVTASLDIYPATGASVVSPELYEFFTHHWDAECSGLAEAGYTVARRAPSLKGAPRRVRAGAAPRSSQWLTGRHVALGTGVALVCGVAMLVLGLSFDVGWLTAVGGVVLGALAFLALLVVFLSS